MKQVIFKNNWTLANKEKRFATKFILSLFCLIVTMLLFARFTEYVEMRQGITFDDPFLKLFLTHDLTWPIFTLIYLSILSAMGILLFHPKRLMILFQAYTLMVLTRIVMMYMMPLNTPIGMISLNDPFVELFGSGKTLTKDLFFSGHTATLFLLFLAVPKKFAKYFLVITLLVAIGVLMQKVHYTVDVLVAPFVSYTVFKMASKWN